MQVLLNTTIQIDGTAFDDTVGNSFAGILDTTTWSFTTVDTGVPAVSSLSPLDGASSVARSVNLTIIFDEIVDGESGFISLYKTSDDSLVEAIDVTSGQVTGTGTTTITIDPSADFDFNTEYYVQIDATAFDDTASNSFAGILDTTTWSFTVVADTPVEEPRRRTSGSSLASRVTNLVAMGNTQLAQELLQQYPQTIRSPLDSPVCPGEISTRTLRAGARGEDVRKLQQFLNCAGFTIASRGPGSRGNETTLFSVKTYIAVVAFQERYASDILTPLGLTKGTGVFGDLSKKKAQMFSSNEY